MRSQDVAAWFGGACLAALCGGCAHHQGNTYAYAPPYAPPVYPQPAVAAQPVSYAAPLPAGPVVAAPGPVSPGGAALAGGAAAGTSNPCPQACPDGTVVGAPVVVEGDGQTPPCPPGP
jgi:hypothetical protein